jgi:hypothetical protein
VNVPSKKIGHDIIPIAAFEHAQMQNWSDGVPSIDMFDICNDVQPVRNFLLDRARQDKISISAEFIFDINLRLVNCLRGCRMATFQSTDEWSTFVKQISEAAAPKAIETFNSGAWILAQLFWHHLTILRLLTPWLIIEALGIQQSSPKPAITFEHFGTFLIDLSASGPPIFDAENLRGKLLQYN